MKSFSAEEIVACLVLPGVAVLAPVDLNDQLSLEADKIEDVVLERGLPPKLDSIEPAVAEQDPEFSLGIR